VRSQRGVVIGAALTSLAVDPVRALYWAAVVNGVLAAPLLVSHWPR